MIVSNEMSKAIANKKGIKNVIYFAPLDITAIPRRITVFFCLSLSLFL